MFCAHCGKENAADGKCCEQCGKPLTEQTTMTQQQPNIMPPQAYPWQQPIDPEVIKKLEEQKASDLKKRVKNIAKISSVMRLISGILQVLLGIRLEYEALRFFIIHHMYGDTVYCKLQLPGFVAFMALGAAILFMGCICILNFHKSQIKNIVWHDNKMIAPIVLLASQIVISILMFMLPSSADSILSIDDIIPFLSAVAVRINSFTTLKVMRTVVNIIIIIVFATAVIAMIIDIINIATVKKNKDVFMESFVSAPQKNAVIFIRTLVIALICTFTLSASISKCIYTFGWSKYDSEKEQVTNHVKYGYLEGYPNKTINDALKDMIDYKGYIYNSIFYYSKLDPRSLDSDAYSSDSIRYVETCYWRKNSNDKTVDTYLTFRVEDNTITLYKIVEGDRTFDEKEMTAWIDDCYNFKAKEQGKKYIKEGMYISDTQKLYSSPDYDSATTYTYNYSGIKTIIGYKVTEDGTLWLKLNGSSDGKYKYFWVPES